MARSALSVFVAVASASYAVAQTPTFPATPLASIVVPYSEIPEQVMTQTVVRGSQVGFNICNSTTQNQQSECQTAFVNNIFDFCFYAPPDPNTPIADSEGYEVAWCTTKKHGTRLIPAGTLTGVQVLNTSQYIQIVAHINQVNVNLPANDTGGELDPHGADGMGNPIGALVYSTAFSSDGVTILQVPEWNNFIGSNISATKVCTPSSTDADQLAFCRNTLDRVGTGYNMPNAAADGVFEVCDSDPILPGVYVSNGQTLTYTQPDESLGPITTVPYPPPTPSSSNCQTYKSTDLYTDILPVTTSTATPTPSGKSGSSSSGTRTGSGNPATSTSGSNGASVVTISLFSTILGVAFSVAFLA